MKINPGLIVLLSLVLSGILLGCSQKKVSPYPTRIHEDGTYRGVFIDKDSIQVNVEFVLKDGIVTKASFRHLRRDDNYHLNTDREPYQSVIAQYQEVLDYLIGKDIEKHLSDLYKPGQIVTTEVDGYTSATLRSNKILSAIRDALNRGAYSH